MSNPLLSERVWEGADAARSESVMTVDGAMSKTVILIMVMTATMWWMWSSFWNGGAPQAERFFGWMIAGGITSLVAVLLGMFLQRLAMLWSLIYALAKGLLLGGITMTFQVRYPGLPLAAAVFTVATLLAMVLLYRTGVIKATPGFVRGVIGATIGLGLGVVLLMVLNLFGIGGGITGMLYGSGWIGIGFSIFCVGLAALNLVIDFAFIEQGAQGRLPKHYEWVAAFGLLVTLVWLYIEILRLLAKLRSR